MTYPLKFRHKVLSLRAREGLTIAQLAARFDIGVASVVRWLKSPVPRTTRNNKATRIDRAALAQDLRAHPDAFRYERAARFGVSQRGIGEALRRPGVTCKKTLSHPKASTEGRRVLRARIKAHEAAGRRIVTIDQSGFASDMPRSHGDAVKGRRCFSTHAWGARGRSNVIGALLAGVLLSPLRCDFNINSDIFHAWISDALIPNLPPAAVLVTDNASFHKRCNTQQAISAAGHILEYLPPYRRDLNPIEHKWAQAKAIRRKTGKATHEIFKRTF